MPIDYTGSARVLLVDDDEDDYIVTRDLLADIPGQPYTLDWEDSYESGLAAIERQAHDVYLLDYRLGGHTGLELLEAARRNGFEAPLILLTGQGDQEIDKAAMAAGAADYLVKDKLDAPLLDRSIRYSLAQANTLAALRQERIKLAERVEARTHELSMANAELAKAAKAKDEFLANMSHELRTPLTGILAMTEVLGRELYGPLNDKQKRHVAILEESGQHLLALINDILDIAKIDADKLELCYSRISLRNVCEAALRLIKQAARKKDLQIDLTIEIQTSVIECDERRLKQMLVNLLSNAVKFTPPNGHIGLSVTADAGKQQTVFTVWDTGIGIPQDRIGQLFKPFSQLDSGLSRQFQGSGLGLSLVERMVKLHGGEVSVVSEENKGSRFSIHLPSIAPAGAIITDSSSPQEPLKHMAHFPELTQTAGSQYRPLILLADDNDFNVTIYTELLQTQGFRVQVANDGVQALEQVAHEFPDLVLMDIQMPNMDGLEAIRRLRANAATKNIPIIALTALAMEGDAERCMDAGATAYLSKPANLGVLMRTIRDLISGVRNGQ